MDTSSSFISCFPVSWRSFSGGYSMKHGTGIWLVSTTVSYLVSYGILYFFFRRIPLYSWCGQPCRIQDSGSTTDTSRTFMHFFFLAASSITLFRVYPHMLVQTGCWIHHSGSTMYTSSSFISRFISCFKQYPLLNSPGDTLRSLVRIAFWPTAQMHFSYHTVSNSLSSGYPHMLGTDSFTEYRIQAAQWKLQAVSFLVLCGILSYFYQGYPIYVVRTRVRYRFEAAPLITRAVLIIVSNNMLYTIFQRIPY